MVDRPGGVKFESRFSVNWSGRKERQTVSGIRMEQIAKRNKWDIASAEGRHGGKGERKGGKEGGRGSKI